MRRKSRIKNKYFAYKDEVNRIVVVFKVGANFNMKIAPYFEKICTQYVFSLEQWEFSGKNKADFEFFSLDQSNCLDCKYAGKKGDCYTHRFHSLVSFRNIIEQVKKEYPVLPNFAEFNFSALLGACKNLYIRFGAYGEPVFFPISQTKQLIQVAKSYTGYTHQWKFYPEFMGVFVASVDTEAEHTTAQKIGWKCFRVVDLGEKAPTNTVLCPSDVVECSTCSLCSSKKGKDIFIYNHSSAATAKAMHAKKKEHAEVN